MTATNRLYKPTWPPPVVDQVRRIKWLRSHLQVAHSCCRRPCAVWQAPLLLTPVSCLAGRTACQQVGLPAARQLAKPIREYAAHFPNVAATCAATRASCAACKALACCLNVPAVCPPTMWMPCPHRSRLPKLRTKGAVPAQKSAPIRPQEVPCTTRTRRPHAHRRCRARREVGAHLPGGADIVQ